MTAPRSRSSCWGSVSWVRTSLGAYGWRWLTIDLVWAVVAGLGVGTLCGAGIGKLVLYLRRVHREAVGLDEFLALGLIALSYGIALLVNAYGFLAVFAAGLSVRRIERQHSEVAPPADVVQAGTQHRGTGDGSGHRPRLHGACGPQLQRATGTIG